MLFFKRNRKGFGGFLENGRIRKHQLEIKY